MGKRARRAQVTAGAPVAARPVAEPPADPNAWTRRDPRYWPVAGAILVLGAAMRLYHLATPAFQHDEAIYSVFSNNFRDYNFDPVYHGPSLYHIIKAFFLVLGDNDFSARLVSVAMAMVTFGLVIGPARRWLGDRAALFSLALYAISPVMVTYQRRILFDAFVVVLTLASVLLFHKVRTSALGGAEWIAAWVGLVVVTVVFLATKANAFFIVAMLVSFFVATVAHNALGRAWIEAVPFPRQLPLLMFGVMSAAAIYWGPRYPEDMSLTHKHELFLKIVAVASSAFLWEWLRRGAGSSRKAAPVERGTAAYPAGMGGVGIGLALSLGAGALVYGFLFGHGYLWFAHPGQWWAARGQYLGDVQHAMTRMLEYWNGQQKTPRLPGRHDFYIPLMIAYELPILVAFIGGVARASRQRSPFTDLLIWWSFTSWTLYAVANEKVPWLMIHLAAPFALLGGWWLAQLKPRGAMQPVAGALAVFGAAYLLRNVSACNYERAVDNREPMFYAFTAESFKDTLFHAIEVTRGQQGDFWIYNAWPPSWWMRSSATTYGAVTFYAPEHEPPPNKLRLAVCMEPDWEKYKKERFAGWHTWTYQPDKGVVADAAGANPHILNWPRLSWYSFRPDLFFDWFVHRKAEPPIYPQPPHHSFFTNTAFLTEWSHIPVVVATPP
jgi:predicted membrane-bound mannosyltransferase